MSAQTDIVANDLDRDALIRRCRELEAELDLERRDRIELEEEFYRVRDELNFQIHEVRDQNERVQQSAEEIVAIAEEAEIAKSELQRLNNNKDKLFSILAHDLRSPFNVLLGYTDLLVQQGEQISPEKRTDFTKTVNEAARNLMSLLEDLLEWSRGQMNKVGFNPVTLNLRVMVEEAFSIAGQMAARKSISLKQDVDEFAVHADTHMLRSVLRNLITNALKFTDAGGVVSVSASLSGEVVNISIRDTGIGMSSDRVEQLFRVEHSKSTMGTGGEAGTGLGLLICKDFVERHGGAISVESSPGNGTTFSFTIPVAEPATQIAAS